MNSFPGQLRWFTATIFAAAVAAAAIVGARDESFPVSAIVLCGGLAFLTAQRHVRLANGASLSPSFMVSMAAVVVCAAHGSLFGAMVVGVLGNVRMDHFGRLKYGWLPFNTAIAAFAFLAVGATWSALPSRITTSMPTALVGILLSTFAYIVVAISLLAISDVIEDGRRLRDALAGLLPAAGEILPFAILGFLLGRLYLSLGPAVMLLIIVPIFIAREMFASYMKVREAHEDTVGMLIRALEAKDRYTAGHAERVATYARYIGEELNFMPARLERLRFAALMHDIGKLVVPNELLNKPGRLTPEEFARVRVHEEVSMQMLSHIDFLRPIASVSHSDHTRFKADDPDHPIEPYIVMIADAYDAMTSTRAYRRALPQDLAFSELREKSGAQFHPACVEALIEALERRGEKHGAGFEDMPHFDNAPDVGLGSAGLGDLLSSETA